MAMSDTGSDNPNGDISPTLEEVARQFSAWQANRAKKREPIPDPLWQAAAALCLVYSIIRIFQIPMSVKGRSS